MTTERDRERLKNVDDFLAAAYFSIKAKFEAAYPGATLTIPPLGGYRTPDQQAGTYATAASGYTGQLKGGGTFSKHQAFPARALDFMVIDAQKRLIVDGHDPLYRNVGEQFQMAGFVWGGWFKRPDFDHCEISGPQPSRLEVLEGYAAFQKAESADV